MGPGVLTVSQLLIRALVLAVLCVAQNCGSPSDPVVPVTTSGGSSGFGGATGVGGSIAGSSGSGGQPDEAALTCSHLAAIGCPEGSSATCAEEIRHIQSLGVRASIDLDCLMLAQSAAQARACLSIACGGIQ